MTTEHGGSSRNADNNLELEDIASAFRDIVEITDRQYGFPPQTFTDCFVGEEAVERLLEHGMATDRGDAVRIGELLLDNGIIHHVQRAHPFKDEYLFYRFAADEDHGRAVRSSVSDSLMARWSDFLAGGSKTTSAVSLQPAMPLPDRELAAMTSVALEEIGVSPLDTHNARLLDNVHPKTWQDPRAKKSYNLVVLGAGAGGLVSAAGAAGVGARVALVESHLLGGDCLNVGCVPSKALLRCAKAVAAVRDAGRYGVTVQGRVEVDFPAIMERMRRLRAEISPLDSAERYSSQLGVDVFLGSGRFTGSHTLEVNGQQLRFAKAVVATGGTAAIPGIPGLAEVPYLTNSSVFNLTELPGRLGVIGAGPIGMELAQAFQRFGSSVTVFSRDGRILPREDPEAADLIKESVQRDGLQFASNVSFLRIEKVGKVIRVHVQQDAEEKAFDFDQLLVATGRKPAVQGLGLEEAGVDFDPATGVNVNDQLQTTNPDIYAVGDVASRYQFTHMADFMARLVIKNALFFGRDKVSDLLIPWCTYTSPEVAHVGLYERDLVERDIPFSTYTRQFAEVDRAIVDGETEGFVKIHVAKNKDTILGATVVGNHAGDLISEITVAMQAGMGLGALASVIHPYPTAAEAIRQCGDAYNRGRLTPTIKAVFYRLMSFRR